MAPSRNSQPNPSETRAPTPPATRRVDNTQRADPRRDGDAGEQTQPADLAIGGLALQLEPQRALGSLAFGVQLLTLELEPSRIAIERFLQRRDDDAGETCLETARRRAGRFEPLRRSGPAAPTALCGRRAKFATPSAASMSCSHGTGIYFAPSQRSRNAFCAAVSARCVDRHHLDVRILGERHGRRFRGAGAIDEDDRHLVARLVPLHHRRDIAAARDPLTVDLLQLVVFVEAGGVDRPGRRHQRSDAPAVARFQTQVAEPGASRIAACASRNPARDSRRA